MNFHSSTPFGDTSFNRQQVMARCGQCNSTFPAEYYHMCGSTPVTDSSKASATRHKRAWDLLEALGVEVTKDNMQKVLDAFYGEWQANA